MVAGLQEHFSQRRPAPDLRELPPRAGQGPPQLGEGVLRSVNFRRVSKRVTFTIDSMVGFRTVFKDFQSPHLL